MCESKKRLTRDDVYFLPVSFLYFFKSSSSTCLEAVAEASLFSAAASFNSERRIGISFGASIASFTHSGPASTTVRVIFLLIERDCPFRRGTAVQRIHSEWRLQVNG